MTTLDAKLLTLRLEHRFTQSEIAEKIGVSQNSYSKWESGKCTPSVKNLQKIAAFYQIAVPDLLDDNKNGDSTADTHSTISIEISKELLKKVLQSIKILEIQLKIFQKLIK